MQSTLKRVLVYDLETGGFSSSFNPITEMAGVVIDLETLEIVETFSVVLLPHLNVNHYSGSAQKEAKKLFTAVSQKDNETNMKTLKFGDQVITPKIVSVMIDKIASFWEFINARCEKFGEQEGCVFTYEQYLDLLTTEHQHTAKLYFDYMYNPQALEVTHISIDMLLEEGVEWNVAAKQIGELIERHTIGNSKPILAGHNILDFDNPFFEKLLLLNDIKLFEVVNRLMIDSLDWARLRWFELPNFTLGTCANALGLSLKEAHRALPDTIANAKVIVAIIKSMRGEGKQQGSYQRRKFSMNF